uniref:Wsv390-like protein n=1 Tax=Metapenaeus joyneri majanivirus TaxID=2984280 RepID=A0A9C7CFE4_9VIRU|nr:MAG: wsv390-like protein [Metapenaeus joyneri majanivirus]
MANFSIPLGSRSLVNESSSSPSPAISLLANKQWCSGVKILDSSSSIIDPKNWPTRKFVLNKFKGQIGDEDFIILEKMGEPNEKSGKLIEHFDVVAFDQCANSGVTEKEKIVALDQCANGGDTEKEKIVTLDQCANGGDTEKEKIVALDQCANGGDTEKKNEKSIRFLFDNKDNTELWSVAHIHSHQRDDMIMRAYCTAPGERCTLRRYENEDNSICLEENTIDATNIVKSIKEGTAKAHDIILSGYTENKENMCIFTIMVLQARQQHLVSCCERPDEVDGISHARLERGNRTGQTFVPVRNLHRKDDEIHMYHVLLLLK